MWKADVRRSWARINLEEFCAQIGVDFLNVFNSALEQSSASADPYPQYQWTITESSRLSFGVLHLVPPFVSDLPTLWEEWFIDDDGQIHHHLLRNHPHELATDVWQGELLDTDHPREVLGIQWHHSNDADLRPLRYR